MKQHVNLTLDVEVLSEFKKLVSNVSADIEGYMRDKLAKGGVSQVQTGPTVSRRQLEEMNREFIKTGRRVSDEEAYLRKIRKFDLLYAVAMQAGLDWKGLTNLQECKPKMRSAWTGSSGLMQEFLIYLDWCEQRRKRAREKQLRDIEEGKVRIADATNFVRLMRIIKQQKTIQAQLNGLAVEPKPLGTTTETDLSLE